MCYPQKSHHLRKAKFRIFVIFETHDNPIIITVIIRGPAVGPRCSKRLLSIVLYRPIGLRVYVYYSAACGKLRNFLVKYFFIVRTGLKEIFTKISSDT